jgi:hypothetical protein
LIAQLAKQNWAGAIVGPHGSGKSTLLESLTPALRAAGWNVHAVALRDRHRRLPARFFKDVPEQRGMIIVDGYELLSRIDRFRLHRLARRRRLGLLVTAHSPTRIPTLVHLAPDERLVQMLVAKLTERAPTLLTLADVAAGYARHGANVREILFDLYDRHETLRRAR